MVQEFNLEEYLSNGIENIVKEAIKASLFNPKESAFIAKYALASTKSRKIRQRMEEEREHIPPFLIASITSVCNLHCKGCYARANNSCMDMEANNQLKDYEWDKIFKEASQLGISFILLAGGEPLIRRDVIEMATKYKDIIFPVFTNGTMIEEDYLTLFHRNRNIIPVISMEGGAEATDERRGKGVYATLIKGMEEMQQKGILYGASITVTKENICEVTREDYLKTLSGYGCKVIFYVEYVPVSDDSQELAPTDKERLFLEERLRELRNGNSDMIFISFPGDEKTSGGCLAAGRGFFHINSHGGAEPCPFSPYSDTNLKTKTLREALQSPLFQKLKDENILMKEHQGGCVLFEQKEIVESLVK